MKNKSAYDIGGDKYEFNNERLKDIIRIKDPSRGAYERFYRKVVSQNKGISYDAVKGWVKNDTNPALDDVKEIAKVLDVPYMQLLECTHYGKENVNNRMQKIKYDMILDAFCLKYDGFSNVLDMIIGMGYDPNTGESINSDFAERIINIIGLDKIEECGLPGLLGYHFVYSDDELKNMRADEFERAERSGFVDADGNSFYDPDWKISIDRKTFGKKLLENTQWLSDIDRRELQEVIAEAEKWWDCCEMPFCLLKIDVNALDDKLASYTLGPGWVKPTHEDRWALILDILRFVQSSIDMTGLCWLRGLYVNQFESEVHMSIDILGRWKYYKALPSVDDKQSAD